MPSNPQADYMKCYGNIDQIIRKNLPKEGIHLQELLIDILIKFPVTEAAVIKFLKKYEDIGAISIRDDIIRKGEVK